MTHEIVGRLSPYCRSRNGLLSRVGGALARPFQTSYVCPSLMTATAVAYAIRGYEPRWSPVGVPDEDGRKPSSVAYQVYVSTEDGRYPSHGVELRPIFPRWAILAECNARNAMMRVKARVMKVTGQTGSKGKGEQT